jgi:hypothetical protein
VGFRSTLIEVMGPVSLVVTGIVTARLAVVVAVSFTTTGAAYEIVTEFDAPDDEPLPALLVAVTLKV